MTHTTCLSIEIEFNVVQLRLGSLKTLLMVLLCALQLMLFESQTLLSSFDEAELHRVVFVLAGLEAEKEAILAQNLSQTCTVCQSAMSSFELVQAIEVRPHLLITSGQLALIRTAFLSLRSRVVACEVPLVHRIIEDLSLERGLNHSEELVLLLLEASLA